MYKNNSCFPEDVLCHEFASLALANMSGTIFYSFENKSFQALGFLWKYFILATALPPFAPALASPL